MTSRKPHVLWIPSWYTLKEDPIMGVFFKEQAAALMETGVKVGVLYPEIRSLKNATLQMLRENHFHSSYAVEDGLPTCRYHGWNIFPKMEKAQMRLWVHAACRLMENYIAKEGKPDVLHAQSALWGGVAAREISKKYGIPYVITEHRDGFLHGRVLSQPRSACWTTPVLQDTLDNASQVFAVGSGLKNAMLPYTKTPRSPLAVLPCFVDTDFFTLPEQAPPWLPFRFLTIAKLVPSKNLELLLRSFRDVVSRHPDTVLEIGGYGVERENLEQLSHELGLSKCVSFLGVLTREEARDAYHRTHAFVLPTQWETFGVVFIEAMASGLPIVTTLSGGPQDIVTEEVGTLVAVNDQQAFTDAMDKMIDHSIHYDPHRIRALAISRFGKDAICQKLVKVYKKF